MLKRPRVIFFDVGNTLLFPNKQIILAPLCELHPEPSQQTWHAIERRTKQQFDREMASGHADHGFWHMFYSHLLGDMGIDDSTLHSRLVDLTRISSNWGDMRPGTHAALERFRQKYSIGVISNADGKIIDLLAANGIDKCFHTITDSGVVGFEKPRPEIFAAALQAMNATPEECLYVGDVHCVDYVGATRAGMQAVLFDVSGAYRDKGVPRVESLEELETLLAGTR